MNLLLICLLVSAGVAFANADGNNLAYEAGHASLKEWLLPEQVPHPADNVPTPERVELGKKLYFDPRLSGDGNMSCATCHNPSLGWSDGLPTAKGAKSMVLGRASPTIINTAYNSIQMWDGRKASLEDQAMGPMEATAEMNMDTARLFKWLNGNAEYRALFAKAYPGEAIDAKTLSKAIATYERTAISNNSPFDRWVKGDANAMTPPQLNGFRLFVGKARCSVCHSAPNFTDNGFHNLGLPSYGVPDPDLGRFAQKPIKRMRGAFKTPTIRDIGRTAPYFHDGSAKTLMEVVEHYNKGGVVKTDLAPDIQPLNLTQQEKEDLVAFMQSLSSPFQTVALPELPKN
jgi:cytochrome c peroxidase